MIQRPCSKLTAGKLIADRLKNKKPLALLLMERQGREAIKTFAVPPRLPHATGLPLPGLGLRRRYDRFGRDNGR
jgi:hypothetical protein